MNINRRTFIKGITGTSVLACTPVLAGSVLNAINDVKNSNYSSETYVKDIIDFAEHDIVFKHSTMKFNTVLKNYLRNISSTGFFICKKCRQSGITTTNSIYAIWRAKYFKNQHIYIVEPKCTMCFEVFHMINRICVNMNLRGQLDSYNGFNDDSIKFNNGNSITVCTDADLHKIDFDLDETTIILDEMAYMRKQNLKCIFGHNMSCDNLKNTNIYIASTPCHNDDIFSLLYLNTSDNSKMTITCYDVFDVKTINKLKDALPENRFNMEMMCEV